jgi:hypothetical protein
MFYEVALPNVHITKDSAQKREWVPVGAQI